MDARTVRVRSVDVIKSRREELHKRLAKSKGEKNTKAYNHPNNLKKVAAYDLEAIDKKLWKGRRER